MEIQNVIITGTLFTLIILIFAGIIVYAGFRKRHALELEMKQAEILKQKEISEHTLMSQEKERQRIGFELHDELGPSFAAARMNINRIQQMVEKGSDPKTIRELSVNASDALQGAIEQFSNVSKLLYPVILYRFGIKEAIIDLIEKANHNSNIDFQLQIADFDINREVVKISLYRICQELCTNAIKHSMAEKVTFALSRNKESLQLQYKDDGVGYDTDLISGGLGLNSIKRRIEAIGGILNTKSEPSEGVRVYIQIPDETEN